MKSKNRVLSGIILICLVMGSQTAKAGIADKFTSYISSEFTNLSGLMIIFGVIFAGIIGKVLHFHFIREKEEVRPLSHLKVSSPRHHRPKPIIKKTS